MSYKQKLEEMRQIYVANYAGKPLSSALLPYLAGDYIDAIVEGEKDISSMADYDQMREYRKIERCFVDDRDGATEMSKIIAKLLFNEKI